MSTEKKLEFDDVIKFLLGLIAIFAVKALFEHDSSRVISKKGEKMLSDDKSMEDLEDKLGDIEVDAPSSHKEVYI